MFLQSAPSSSSQFLHGTLHSMHFILFLIYKILKVWAILNIFIEFVTKLLLFHVLVFWPQAMWDLNSPTRDQTHSPLVER